MLSWTDLAATFSVLSVFVLLIHQRKRLIALPNKPAYSEPEPVSRKEKPTTLAQPDPYYDFDLETAHTRNHIYVNKTLRFPYFQTMAHQPMHINDWIEIDKDYAWYIEHKTKVIQEKGKVVVDSLPENDDACAELLETLVDYLPKRFPTLFSPIRKTGIHNKITGEEFVETGHLTGVDALLVVSRLVQDDFLMGKERDDGHVYFSGGLVAFPGFYTLAQYIGQPLEQVHKKIPHFNEKILMSVERTLKRFKEHEPFERTSWSMVDDRNLFLHSIISSQRLQDSTHPKDMWLRMDHQTFRKLPRSNGIIFGVHVMLKRLEDLVETPLVPALLAKIHTDGDRALMDYKEDHVYKERLMPYLQELTKRQLEKGLISEEDLDKVADFRSLVKDGVIPNPQTTLSRPTESEKDEMVSMV
ncbi:hypothetical protein CYLTODRAFT_417183 [Cylindrobasidium torrendii FP15055 ss-10]|uniref:Uncharacterized protein n=1 Tax=Cylindrobasidium torrendii FP15055 ss-10 TaxID=1314674 RepID=A0A0D7BRR5_9AGAR|nr:hypothetical protein CYLTODRAFT_417183 [Cylindrobasidium torrendii FP15055 ss-10]